MSENDKSGKAVDQTPAFPFVIPESGRWSEFGYGMSLRDYFAAHAPAGILQSMIGGTVEDEAKFAGINPREYNSRTHHHIARVKAAYIYADTMMVARQTQQSPESENILDPEKIVEKILEPERNLEADVKYVRCIVAAPGFKPCRVYPYPNAKVKAGTVIGMGGGSFIPWEPKLGDWVKCNCSADACKSAEYVVMAERKGVFRLHSFFGAKEECRQRYLTPIFDRDPINIV